MALLALALFLIIFLFLYFYYIKPQKEFIKLGLQDCFNKATDPINEVLSENNYETRDWMESMLQTQNEELKKCSYDSFLFSKGEENLIKLNLTMQLDDQKKLIDKYIEKIEARSIEQDRARAQDKATQEACFNMKIEKKNYDGCVSAERAKNNSYYSSIDYINFSLDLFEKIKGDINKDICLSRYNYQRFGVSEMLCSFRGY